MKLYVARDKDGSLWLYNSLPIKEHAVWFNTTYMRLDTNLFPDVKWENGEPTEVELVIKRN